MASLLPAWGSSTRIEDEFFERYIQDQMSRWRFAKAMCLEEVADTVERQLMRFFLDHPIYAPTRLPWQ